MGFHLFFTFCSWLIILLFRFIEWGACCCSGANIEFVNGGSGLELDECKDTCFKHLVRTKACKALAQLPSYMPLYSG